MTYLDIAQIIFIASVFAIGLIGFYRAATSDDDKK